MDKKLLFLSTGGTIACKPTPNGLAPALTASDMLDISDMSGESIEGQDLFNMDSSNIQPEEWLSISSDIFAVAKRGQYNGVVLAHGTDTMAYTASMLTFLLRHIDIPIVLTGAQYPIIQPDSDGRKNLHDAIIAARSLERGVYVCFGGSVMLGCRSVKTHTFSLNAFESINYPYAGVVLNEEFIPLKTRLDSDSVCELTPSPFTEETDKIDSNVMLIKLIPGTSPRLIEATADCGAKGVVIESFGMGGVHSFRRDHTESLKKLMLDGIVVVLASQCLYESSTLDVYEVSRPLRDAGVISARDMTTEAAVTKLMWALGQTHDLNAVRRIMHTNYCGEISDHD